MTLLDLPQDEQVIAIDDSNDYNGFATDCWKIDRVGRSAGLFGELKKTKRKALRICRRMSGSQNHYNEANMISRIKG